MAVDPTTEEIQLSGFDYWRLCDELSVVQAALLVAGCDPSIAGATVEWWDMRKRPTGYEAAKTSISNALRSGTIKGDLIPIVKEGGYGVPIDGSIDIAASRIRVDSLCIWLASRGFSTGFFFPVGTDSPDYLDPNHPRYAPKLAAAVSAWLAVTDPKGKHPKQALVKWLRENAAKFGMCDEDGKPIENGIEETAKVANWQPRGGAPKTPGG
jgi:hypothetical protein